MLKATRILVFSWLQWLRPGLGVKRWLILLPLGLLPVVIGVALLVGVRITDIFDIVATHVAERLSVEIGDPKFAIPAGIILIFIGLSILMAALIAVNQSIVSAIAPTKMGNLADYIVRKRNLASGPRIVVLGGGTGLATLLRGLKQYSSNVSAIVTTTDDGGSSGQLQRQMGGVLPPGDIRNCLVALADAEPLMQELFQYRFKTRNDDDGLSGHSLGNLFLSAMAEVTGDFDKAIKATSTVLAIRGDVIPSTVDGVTLVGTMVDGTEITGETRIAGSPISIASLRLCPEGPRAVERALTAVREADFIVLGPGSLYTSVIPHLLIPELVRAIVASHAPRCYVCNIMTQPGETDGYTASEHVAALQSHAKQCLKKGSVVIDSILVNDQLPTEEARERYRLKGSIPVEVDMAAIKALGVRVVKANLVSGMDVIRHDSDKLAAAIIRLVRLNT